MRTNIIYIVKNEVYKNYTLHRHRTCEIKACDMCILGPVGVGWGEMLRYYPSITPTRPPVQLPAVPSDARFTRPGAIYLRHWRPRGQRPHTPPATVNEHKTTPAPPRYCMTTGSDVRVTSSPPANRCVITARQWRRWIVGDDDDITGFLSRPSPRPCDQRRRVNPLGRVNNTSCAVVATACIPRKGYP